MMNAIGLPQNNSYLNFPSDQDVMGMILQSAAEQQQQQQQQNPGDEEMMMIQRKDSKNETIHSGHFMVSELDENGETAESQAGHESDCDQPDVSNTDEAKEVELQFESQETTRIFGAGPSHVTIDVSLSKLFQCMSLAYQGKLTSPKWKSFKGLRLKLKDKIRLNNIIWRAWHIQCE